MDAANLELAAGLVGRTYVDQGAAALSRRRRLVKTLLSQRRLPAAGWDEAAVEALVRDCAAMDSNNFLGAVSVGEREARVASALIARRHWGLAHGVGRSGDVAAEQPKAAGSSLLAKLANALAADALRVAGMAELGPALVLPLATGMTLTLALLALRAQRPEARFVIWPRVDQKTCLKCVAAAGLTPLVVELRCEGDQLVTDLDALEAAIARVGPAAVAALLTTSSCFAPRAPDDVVGAARLAARLDVPHLVNNAYGVAAAATAAALTAAWRRGRVDGVVQSCDKNFMVPVGGAVLTAPRARPGLVDAVRALYPGRAAAGPALDLLATLLGWGEAGWRTRLAEREALFVHARGALGRFAATRGERLLETPGNPVSLALGLGALGEAAAAAGRGAEGVTFLGAMLFARGASGARVIVPGVNAEVAGIKFVGYGAHCDAYPLPYLTVAAALGGTPEEVDEFLRRLGAAMDELRARFARGSGAGGAAEAAL
jgi:O-phospho-L-seryl-tRNASec:L-selenocysteinyl-tRNA synthase